MVLDSSSESSAEPRLRLAQRASNHGGSERLKFMVSVPVTRCVQLRYKFELAGFCTSPVDKIRSVLNALRGPSYFTVLKADQPKCQSRTIYVAILKFHLTRNFNAIK